MCNRPGISIYALSYQGLPALGEQCGVITSMTFMPPAASTWGSSEVTR